MKDTGNTKKNQQSLAHAVHKMTQELHLSGLRHRLEEILGDATWQQMTPLEQIYDLLNAEVIRREANTAVRLRRHSNLPLDLINARFEELYESKNRRWDTRLMTLVKDGQWMLRETPADLILSGACGVGKSFLAACCANYMLDRRHSVYFIRSGRLFMDLKIHRVNNSLEKRKAELKKIDLLILDDFLIEDMSEEDCADLLDIINDRNRLKSTIYTSQFKLEGWIERLGNSAMTQAVIDRIAHSSYRLHLEGASQRRSVEEKENLRRSR